MSFENRQRMYNELVAKKQFHRIDESLIKEFGSPPVEAPPKKVKKKNGS